MWYKGYHAVVLLSNAQWYCHQLKMEFTSDNEFIEYIDELEQLSTES
jgi:HPt (histidine-containing phosphotransfer) domain-containing protein